MAHLNNAFKQASINFNLRDRKAKKCTSVICIIGYDGVQYRHSTNKQVNPLYWNKREQKAVISPMLTNEENDNNFALNNEIKRLKLAFDEFNYYFCNHKDENIKDVITRYFKNESSNETSNAMPKQFTKKGLFTSAYNTIIEQKKKSNAAQATLNEYKSAFNAIIEYVEDSNVVIKGNEFLVSGFQKKIASNLRRNTIKKYCNIFLCIIRELRENEATRNYGIVTQEFKHLPKETKVKNTEKGHFELTDDEVNTIKTTELEDTKLNNVRLAFSIMLCTGLRHSDLIQTIEKINATSENDLAEIETKKTKYTAYVKATKELKELCAMAHNFHTLNYVKVNKTFNEYLRKLAKELGLNRQRTYYNDKNEKVTEAVHEHLTSHSARVTRATKSIREGMTFEQVQRHQGWEDIETLKKVYAQLTADDNKEIVKRLDKEHEERQKRQNNNTTTNNETIDEINEYKCVLSMLDVDSAIWCKINNKDQLARLVHYNEMKLFVNYGIDYKTIKDIFNDGSTIAEQRKRLEAAIKATGTHQ